MNFEGFEVETKGKGGISSVLTSYTELVSIEELSNKEAIKSNLKDCCHQYDDSGVEEKEQFHIAFKLEMDYKFHNINKGLRSWQCKFRNKGEKAVCTKKFTKKQMNQCTKAITKNASKSCKEDGIQY